MRPDVIGTGEPRSGLLIQSSPRFSCGFMTLTFVSGALSIVAFLDRLFVLTPSSPLVVLPATVEIVGLPVCHSYKWQFWFKRQ